jgi:hypothetical protein
MDGKFQLQNHVLIPKRIRHGVGIMSKIWGKKRDKHGREVKEKWLEERQRMEEKDNKGDGGRETRKIKQENEKDEKNKKNEKTWRKRNKRGEDKEGERGKIRMIKQE